MDYEKPTYRLFILWMLAFFAVLAGAAAFLSRFFPALPDGAAAKIFLLLAFTLLDLLFWIIYRTERVYWFTGLTYKESAKSGSIRRRAYAMAHLRRFLLVSAVLAAYCAAGFALRSPALLDAAVSLVLLLAAVVSSLRIKL